MICIYRSAFNFVRNVFEKFEISVTEILRLSALDPDPLYL
jgi:hypothetical protein